MNSSSSWDGFFRRTIFPIFLFTISVTFMDEILETFFISKNISNVNEKDNAYNWSESFKQESNLSSVWARVNNDKSIMSRHVLLVSIRFTMNSFIRLLLCFLLLLYLYFRCRVNGGKSWGNEGRDTKHSL